MRDCSLKNYNQQFTADSKYAALILTKTSEFSKMVILDNGQQLDTRYSKFYRNAIQQKLDDEYLMTSTGHGLNRELKEKTLLHFAGRCIQPA
jgi:hypothetical protein